MEEDNQIREWVDTINGMKGKGQGPIKDLTDYGIKANDQEILEDCFESLSQPARISTSESLFTFPKLRFDDMVYLYHLLDEDIDAVENLTGLILENLDDLINKLGEDFSWASLFDLAADEYRDFI